MHAHAQDELGNCEFVLAAGFSYRLEIHHRGFEPFQSVRFISPFSPTAACCAYLHPELQRRQQAVVALLHQGLMRRISLSVINPRGNRQRCGQVKLKKNRAISQEKQAGLQRAALSAHARLGNLQTAAGLSSSDALEFLTEKEPIEAKVIEIATLEDCETGLYVVQAVRRPGQAPGKVDDEVQQKYSFFQREAASTLQRWIRRIIGEPSMKSDGHMRMVVFLPQGHQYVVQITSDGVCRHLDPPAASAAEQGNASLALRVMHKFMNSRSEEWTSCVLSVEARETASGKLLAPSCEMGPKAIGQARFLHFSQPDQAMIEGLRALNRSRELEQGLQQQRSSSVEETQEEVDLAQMGSRDRAAAEALLAFYLFLTCSLRGRHLSGLASLRQSEMVAQLRALADRGDGELAEARDHLQAGALELSMKMLSQAKSHLTHAGVLSRAEQGQAGAARRAPPGEWTDYISRPTALFGMMMMMMISGHPDCSSLNSPGLFKLENCSTSSISSLDVPWFEQDIRGRRLALIALKL